MQGNLYQQVGETVPKGAFTQGVSGRVALSVMLKGYGPLQLFAQELPSLRPLVRGNHNPHLMGVEHLLIRRLSDGLRVIG